MPVNKITDGTNSFTFIRISTMPSTARNQISLQSRDGVDGHSVWNTGSRGVPEVISTIVDLANVGAGETAFDAYCALIGSVVEITYAGQLRPNKYDVLDVRPVPDGLRAITLGVGGVSGGSIGALLIAEWTVIATDVASTGLT